ncbi:ATP-binding protein [Rhizobium sp. FY34]|uniref:hybrid sensor histidine kinase/response regulator n=1 Tax=Rhizobium sp. FY34 TaxID=2562309 RepID=UPI00148568A9|nr:ATP-binding protein [Rhizobium sp. FY34]
MRELADLQARLRSAFGSDTTDQTVAPVGPGVAPVELPRRQPSAQTSVLASFLNRVGAMSRFAGLEAGVEAVDTGVGSPSCADGLLSAGSRSFLESNDLLAIPAVVRSLDGMVQAANRSFRTATGCPNPQGQTLEALGLPLSCDVLAQPRDIEIASGEGVKIYAWQDVVVRDAVSRDLMILSAARDVTAERHLAHLREEARLHAEEASAAKSRQLATVVHELRTPLNGILGMGQLLHQTALTLEQKNYIGGIRQAGSALAQLVDDLLDYSTIEAGRFRLNSRAENLRQLLESVVEMLAPRAHQKGIEIGSTVSFDVPSLMDFDPARLRQVLFNVIGNAVKFTKIGGVLIRVNLDGRDIVITVADTGPGMTAEERQRIFGEFEQTGTADERSGGTGLGLSISARILHEFGGSLSVASEKGVGTTFSIRFPALSAEAGKEGSDRMLLLRSSRVLLLAPVGPAATATFATIETLGGRCRHVKSVEEADWAIAQMERQGVAFTDMVVDHRICGLEQMGPAAQDLRRILLVSPEERGTQPWDVYDAWLIRPLREQSLVDVLRGRLGGAAGRQLASAIAEPQAAQTDRRHVGLSVLLAEDDPVSAMMVGAVLRKAGCIVHHVSDLAALQKAALADGHTDLIISDIHMPDGDLADVLPLLGRGGRAANASAPLLVLSGETDSNVTDRVMAGGARRVLQKPIDPQQLLEEVRSVLSARPLRDAS